jgi:hypothetical protein
LSLDLAFVEGQLVFCHEITHTVCYQSVSQFYPLMGAVCRQTKPLYPVLHKSMQESANQGGPCTKNADMQRELDKECAPLQKMGLLRQGLTEYRTRSAAVGIELAVG